MERLNFDVYISNEIFFGASLPMKHVSEDDMSHVYDFADELRSVLAFGYCIEFGDEKKYADALLRLYYAGYFNRNIRSEDTDFELEMNGKHCRKNTGFVLKVWFTAENSGRTLH